MGSLIIWSVSEGKERDRWVEAWSELARQTGLEFDPGLRYLPGKFLAFSGAPEVGGIYRGRPVLISVLGKARFTTLGTVYIEIRMDVNNRRQCDLAVVPTGSPGAPLQQDLIPSGDSESGWPFKFSGFPADFLQEAIKLIVRHPILLDRPDDVMMVGQDPERGSHWTRPSIHIAGWQLLYQQCGVLTYIPGQVSILDLLCDLAELAEGS